MRYCAISLHETSTCCDFSVEIYLIVSSSLWARSGVTRMEGMQGETKMTQKEGDTVQGLLVILACAFTVGEPLEESKK